MLESTVPLISNNTSQSLSPDNANNIADITTGGVRCLQRCDNDLNVNWRCFTSQQGVGDLWVLVMNMF